MVETKINKIIYTEYRYTPKELQEKLGIENEIMDVYLEKDKIVIVTDEVEED